MRFTILKIQIYIGGPIPHWRGMWLHHGACIDWELPGRRICRHIPRLCCMAPKNIRGQDFILYILQWICSSIWKNTITGRLIKRSQKNFKLELRVQGQLFPLDYELYENFATHFWVKHLRKFLCDTNIEIDEDIKGDMILMNVRQCWDIGLLVHMGI